MTLKQNVLFNRAFDEERYNRCIRASGLEQDINMLPGKDETEIGVIDFISLSLSLSRLFSSFSLPFS